MCRGSQLSARVSRKEGQNRAQAAESRMRLGRTCELSHARDARSSSGGEDVADLDLLDEVVRDARALDDGLEDGDEEVLRAGVLEASLLGAGEGRASSSTLFWREHRGQVGHWHTATVGQRDAR